MLNDTSHNFKDIHSSPEGFHAQVIHVKDFITDRQSTQQWASQLRFLTFDDSHQDVLETSGGERKAKRARLHDFSPPLLNDDTPKMGSCAACTSLPFFPIDPCAKLYKRVSRLRITKPNELPGCTHYVCVSYCWHQTNHEKQLDKYRIRVKNIERENIAPTLILDRAIAYAAYYGIRLIWIDQECIDQDDRTDKELGVQSMDMVYQRSEAPLGLLQTKIDSQEELTALTMFREYAEFLTGNDWNDETRNESDSNWFLNYFNITPELIMAGAHFLCRLNDDPWFTRAWILQESTSAGDYIDFMVKCDNDFIKTSKGENKEHIESDWGSITGEIEMKWEQIGQCFTMVIHLATECNKVKPGVFSDDFMLTMRQNRNLLMGHTPSSLQTHNDAGYRMACNAAQASLFLNQCFNSRVPDRLAILANLCQYPIRLNTFDTADNRFSLSTCLFVQALLNGDVSFLAGSSKQSWKTSWSSSSTSGLHWVMPPTASITDLTAYNEGPHIFRLHDHFLTTDGISLPGFLWNIHMVIDVSAVQLECLSRFNNLVATNPINQLDSTMFGYDPEAPLVENELGLARFYTDLLWSLLRYLIINGNFPIAQAIWHSERRKIIGFTRKEWKELNNEYRNACDSDEPSPEFDEWMVKRFCPQALIPAKITSVLSTRGDIIWSSTPYFSSVDDSWRLLHPSSDLLDSWLVQQVMKRGRLFVGHLSGHDLACDQTVISTAVFDVDKECKIFLPHSKRMEELEAVWSGCLPTLRGKRVSWIVEIPSGSTDVSPLISRLTGESKLISGPMVAGVWTVQEQLARRYTLA